MWNIPDQARLEEIPRLYETEDVPLKEKRVYLHFFIGGSDWYVVEYDGKGLFFGFAILNNDYEMAEWGYISFEELKSVKVAGCLEVDCELPEHWKVRKAHEVESIAKAMGWQMPDARNKAGVDIH